MNLNIVLSGYRNNDSNAAHSSTSNGLNFDHLKGEYIIFWHTPTILLAKTTLLIFNKLNRLIKLYDIKIQDQ